MITSEIFALRVRRQNVQGVEVRTAPFVQSGRLTTIIEDTEDEDADGGIVVMQAGRTTMHFFIKDFAVLFQGYHNAQRLLRNAVKHKDFVEIRVMRERLSYHNKAQYARIPKT
jgi:hypothetical protein